MKEKVLEVLKLFVEKYREHYGRYPEATHVSLGKIKVYFSGKRLDPFDFNALTENYASIELNRHTININGTIELKSDDFKIPYFDFSKGLDLAYNILERNAWDRDDYDFTHIDKSQAIIYQSPIVKKEDFESQVKAKILDKLLSSKITLNN